MSKIIPKSVLKIGVKLPELSADRRSPERDKDSMGSRNSEEDHEDRMIRTGKGKT